MMHFLVYLLENFSCIFCRFSNALGRIQKYNWIHFRPRETNKISVSNLTKIVLKLSSTYGHIFPFYLHDWQTL